MFSIVVLKAKIGHEKKKGGVGGGEELSGRGGNINYLVRVSWGWVGEAWTRAGDPH